MEMADLCHSSNPVLTQSSHKASMQTGALSDHTTQSNFSPVITVPKGCSHATSQVQITATEQYEITLYIYTAGEPITKGSSVCT